MKKQVYTSAALVLLSLSGLEVQAQSKIKDGTISGTSSLPRAGAILELESSNKGAMMPRVSLTATTTWGLLGTDSAGMVVYNNNPAITGTATAPTLGGGVGFYYWDGDRWVGMSAGAGTGDFWRLRGNTSTTPPTSVGTAVGSNNYWGTTDAKNLAVGTNGTTRAIFDQNGSLYGGSGTYDAALSPAQSLVWGLDNKDSANYTLVAGQSNIIAPSSSYSIVAGLNNYVAGRGSLLVGEKNVIKNNANPAIPYYNVVGGYGNFIGDNAASGGANDANFVVGYVDSLIGTGTALVGGFGNKLYDADFSAVFGSNHKDSAQLSLVAGTLNVLAPSATGSIVAGGWSATPGTFGNYLSGRSSAVFGTNHKDSAHYSLVAGYNNVLRNNAQYGAAIGTSNVVNGIGNGAWAIGNANTVTADRALALGTNCIATGDYAMAFGSGNSATGLESTAMGTRATASGVGSFAWGHYSTASGNYGVAIGYGDTAIGTGFGAYAIGYQNKVTGNLAAALGSYNNVSGSRSASVGTSNIVIGDYAFAANNGNIVTGESAAAFGDGNRDSASSSLVAGQNNSLAPGASRSIAVGFQNRVTHYASGALGNLNKVSGDVSFALGNNNEIKSRAAFSSGENNIINNAYGTTFGGSNVVSGDYGFAAGNSNTVTGTNSVGIGSLNNVTSTGSMNTAIAIGNANIANGNRAVAIGYNNNVVGDQNIAIGNTCSVPSGFSNATVMGDGATANASNSFTGQYTGGYRLFSNGGTVGVSLAASGTSWTSISDKRSKENIRTINYGLQTVMALRPTRYNYIGAKNTSLGFIAQEVKEVVPEVVELTGMGPNKDYLGVKYSELIPVLTKAIQEQQAQIEALQAQNTKLAAQVTTAEANNKLVAELSQQVREMQQMLGVKKIARGSKVAAR